ncbi:MAG: hypothetical protein A2289_10465 [Deltaproteobacteria bacterium RIFOXYA12_FULL_58_15]|nr:MAG: hypothetical protein A2289_10465 [Deltaproteobacteria bacterium RIFOXYA12_FULL_58_15]OGR15059.1 MAG: hypothetical protein A2341_05665 [Deltaproteobacteria bacterium RIFOXYB12_FULL_58_9]
MNRLAKAFTEGTHRWCRPRETLDRINPHLVAMGITRNADVTGLDCLKIPTFCSIRPQGKILQVSNGKGLTSEAAEVSALMEAIELYHAENPPAELRRSTALEMRDSGDRFWVPVKENADRPTCYYSSTYVMDWVLGADILCGEPTWIVASIPYVCTPSLLKWNSNGLASGNHIVEATLHGLYEVVERDSITLFGERADERRHVDLDTIDDPSILDLLSRIHSAGLEVCLIYGPNRVPVHTFWAAIIDRNAFAASTRLVGGSGSHLCPAVAASRALTEAAQARLGLIHASREDLVMHYSERYSHEVFDIMMDAPVNTCWQQFEDRSTDNLENDLDLILGDLRAAGMEHVYRVDLTRSEFEIPVARVIVPGLGVDPRLLGQGGSSLSLRAGLTGEQR